jgi:hypothetical protein
VKRFRKICRFIHREFGFFAVGLTVVYAVSGIAVNHVDSWNPNYRLGAETFRIEPVTAADTETVTAAVLAQLDLPEPVKNVWRATPTRLRIICESATYDVDLPSGEVLRTGYEPRPVFHEVNYLHLNHGKGIWTWLADGYAVLLFLLAFTGIFLVSGRKGLSGRGGVWLGLGFALPLVYLAWQLWI